MRRSEQPTGRREVVTDIVWGIIVGIRVGVVFAVLATVARIVFGAKFFGNIGHDTYPVDVMSDLCAGLPAGTVVGAFRRFITSAGHAALVGFFAAIPVALVGRVEFYRLAPWKVDDTVAVIIWSLIMGPAAGLLIWYRRSDQRARRR